MSAGAAPLPSNILIVDDDDAQRQTLCDIMRDEGFEPIGCANATDALARAARESLAVAVVDLRLPDMSGIDVLRGLRNQSGGVRVIVHTAFGSFESAREALNLGAFAYVEKLTDPRELLEHVHRAVDARLAQALGDEEGSLRAVTEQAPDVILQVERDGTIAFVNRAVAGRTAAELVGRSLYDWVVPEHEERLEACLSAVLEDGRVHECELASAGPDASRAWFSCRVGPVVLPRRATRAILVARDVTEAKQRQHVEQVVVPLLRNALEAMSGGGSISIAIEPVELDDRYAAEHGEARPGPHVRITVQDNGSGIRAETLERMFEPFFSTRAPAANKGLGLTEVYWTVGQAGGHIAVESEPGRGTTIEVHLPATSRRPLFPRPV